MNNTFENALYDLSNNTPDTLGSATLKNGMSGMNGTKEMKRMIFMHMNDPNFFNQEKTRVNSNDLNLDPFDSYIK